MRLPDDECVWLGDRMGQGHPLHVKATQLHTRARSHLMQRHLFQKTRLTELSTGYRGRECGAIHGSLQLTPQVMERANMVLMGVRDDDPLI